MVPLLETCLLLNVCTISAFNARNTALLRGIVVGVTPSASVIAVHQQLNRGEVACGCADFACVLDAVAASSEADPFGLNLVRSLGCDDSTVSYNFSWRYVLVADEVHCVGTCLHVWKNTLRQSSHFVRCSC